MGVKPRRLAHFEVDSVPLPDSAAAHEAMAICQEMRPPMLINHSYRTYLWAVILADLQQLSLDQEALFVSSLLHDLGLSEHLKGAAPTCFTVRGARACQVIGRRHSWDQQRSDSASEATRCI
jgi:hypothetical protein